MTTRDAFLAHRLWAGAGADRQRAAHVGAGRRATLVAMNSVLAGAFALVCGLASFAVSAAPSEPLEFYREYQAVLGNAKSLDPLVKERGAWKVDDDAWATQWPR